MVMLVQVITVHDSLQTVHHMLLNSLGYQKFATFTLERKVEIPNIATFHMWGSILIPIFNIRLSALTICV